MALRKGLTWKGAEVTQRVQDAAGAAIDETMAACLSLAIPRAPFRTGFLRASSFVRPARMAGGAMVGQWGFSALYAAYVELGTFRAPARPFMRPAADAMYPTLAGRIRARLR